MTDNGELRRLNDDRRKLYQKLCRIGYVPDDDMREAIDDLKAELNARIIIVSDTLMVES